MSFVRGIYRRIVPEKMRVWVRRNLLSYPIEEVHIERIEQTHEKLFRWIKRHKETMLMLTFSIHEPTPKTLTLYRKITEVFSNPVGLHVHISDGLYTYPPPPLQDYKTQYKIIKRGLTHLSKLGVETKDFASGNWNYNRDTFLVCKRLGLTNIHIQFKEIPNVTLKYGFPRGVSLIPVVKYIHDYEI